ncbi:SAM-dependent methyltransferase [Lunatimonas salinarum]|uniref:SAM-dependent methyltransferase n=1 Tax=Lunatimonas salinarum TaxID=1774590 RepID=UPI001ADEEE90|nr:SAM-dependent methyltransferase [Lunatimonas salinarum]
MHSNGKLYLIPNVLAEGTASKVIAPQVKEVISHTQYYLVENFRTVRRYISSLQLGVDIGTLHMALLDKNTSEAQMAELMRPIFEGQDMGILSEAGCPGIADPGALAVAYAHRKGIQVVPIPGPSSIFLALMGSGFSGQAFAFHGYLPIEKKDRAAAIRHLEAASRRDQSTQIFMETPFRNQQLAEDLLQHLQPTTQLCIGKNLTAADEEIRTLPVSAWRSKGLPALHKIPTVFLLSVS